MVTGYDTFILHRMKKQQDQKQASSQNRKRFVLPGPYEEYVMQVAAFVECHGTIYIYCVCGKSILVYTSFLFCKLLYYGMFLSGMEK